MSALPPPSDPSSPLHYPSPQTALLLLDYHNFVIELCGDTGKPAVKQASALRDWAVANGILVIHCLIDAHGTPPPTAKGGDRLKGFLQAAQGSAGEEHDAVQVVDPEKEVLLLRQPGLRSGLKSVGIEKLLNEKRVKVCNEQH